MKTITATVRVTLEVPEEYDEHDAVSYIGWRLDVPGLDGEWPEDIDVSIMKATAIKEGLHLQPGDMAEHRFRELDPREVVSITRDTVTLDILGNETTRIPMDNYYCGSPADGRL